MKTPIIPFLYCGIAVCGLSSCGEEEAKLAAKEAELSNQVESQRKKLNELVRKVDEIETNDRSELLIDAELKLDSYTRQIEFEKSEQASLAEEVKSYEKQLAEYRKKYPLKGE